MIFLRSYLKKNDLKDAGIRMNGLKRLEIYCFRKSKQISWEMECRTCFFRRRCRAFQLWLQPDLPFSFKVKGEPTALEMQYYSKFAIDTLFPSEYRHLRQLAIKQFFHGDEEMNENRIRLKMYELLTGEGEFN